ncbi:MAG: carboxypeptidase family protein [Rhodospirillaceae bacterium]|nr:carboxypeptidase family protein [Rhodospirillaceae bacterium]
MLRIISSFDGGNIEVVKADDPCDIQLNIRQDTNAEFLQWFYFKVIGVKNTPCTIKILNAGEASFTRGWENYKAVASVDQQYWTRVPTEYENGILEIQSTPSSDAVCYAYFVPYPSDRHSELIARCQASEGVGLSVPGLTKQNRPIEVLTFGSMADNKPALWIIARQHPGETMAEWFMEGLLDRLLNQQDGAVRSLLQRATLYTVPNMNPDGSMLGNLRVNSLGVNLNREWENPSIDNSPEVFHVRKMMIESKIRFCLDVHGDEGLPFNFIAGFEGIAEASEKQLAIMNKFRNTLAQVNPDFQLENGYPKVARGKGMKTTSTGYLAAYHGAVSMTLEMPFKDAENAPDEHFGWSPERSMALGRSSVESMLAVIDEIKS